MVTMESFNKACVEVFGDPKFKAELKRMDDEHDAALARMGLKREDVENELARRMLAGLVR